jgi:UDP-N-acetylmuramoyl-tripeptide--D-alanyl-D-alanine ligase
MRICRTRFHLVPGNRTKDSAFPNAPAIDPMNTLHDLQQVTGGVLNRAAHASREAQATPLGKVVTDSRRVEPGDIFWALVGKHYNGVRFAPEAFARGASGMVASETVEPSSTAWTLTVPAPLESLWQWARWKRGRFDKTVIGVTGSVGKTTTRQMIHTVLGTRLTGTASPRNYNNHVGVPLSLLQIEPEHDYAVIELGASGEGEIRALAELSAPTIGVITNVGDAHLSGFGGRQGVARAKAELLAVLPPNGHAVVGDDPWLKRLARPCRAPVTCVGRNPECDLVATDVEAANGQLTFRLEECRFRVPVWGRHHLTSVLAAVAVARELNFELPEIAAALAGFAPVPMRCEVVEARGAMIINDTYNASPMAMKAALELLRDFDTPGRRIIVAGDMAELGEESAVLHRQLGSQIVAISGADVLIACGRFARHVVVGARAAGMSRARSIACDTPQETLPYLGQMILPGDVALVKGSRALGMECVVEALRKYPERRSA